MSWGAWIRRAVAALVGMLFVAPVLAVPAYAHTELANAIPGEGMTLGKTPGSVQLQFTEPVDAGLASMVVRGPEGENLADGPPRQNAEGLMQPIVPAAKAGRIEVDYRVISLDGHPVSGSYTFSVQRGDPAAADRAQAAPAQPAGPSGPTDAKSSGSGSLVTPLLLGAAVVLLIAVGGLAARRRRAHSTPPVTQTPHGTTPAS